MVKLPWPPWVVLRLQDMADSYGHQFSLSAGLPVFTSGSLFFLSLISIIKYPKGPLGVGALGFGSLIVTFGVSA